MTSISNGESGSSVRTKLNDSLAITDSFSVSSGKLTVTANSASAAMTVTQTGAGNAFVVEDSTSPDANPFVVDASGSVGIGTITPGEKLDVSGNGRFTSGGDVLTLKYISDGASVRLAWKNASGTTLWDMVGGTINRQDEFAIRRAGTSVVYLDNSSNVGIGNTAPVAKLHVTGASITTGVVYKAQPAQTSKAAAATLTIAELLTGIVQYTGAAATLTLPTGTSIEGGLPATFPTDMSFDVSVINTGAALLTIGANGNTTVGAMTVATLTSGLFRFRKTAANTYTVYRVS